MEFHSTGIFGRLATGCCFQPRARVLFDSVAQTDGSSEPRYGQYILLQAQVSGQRRETVP